MNSKRRRALAVVVVVGVSIGSAAVAMGGGSGRSTDQTKFAVPASDETAFGVAKCGNHSSTTGIGFDLDGGKGFVSSLLLPSSNKATLIARNESNSQRVNATTTAICRSGGGDLIKKNSALSFTDLSETYVSATCPEGSSVTGGGASLGTGLLLMASYPASKRTWRIEAYQSPPGGGIPIQAVAICDPKHSYAIKSKADGPAAQGGSGSNLSATARCRSDQDTTGGGFTTGKNVHAQVRSSRPKGAGSWVSEGKLTESRTLTSYAVCRK
ncbi:hypothetical protein BH10ACT11_BH10ACT11_09100 [soil metagenome]